MRLVGLCESVSEIRGQLCYSIGSWGVAVSDGLEPDGSVCEEFSEVISGVVWVSRYLILNRLTQSIKMDSNKGPKITPINPKRDSPITTPKMVMSGWMLAIFFRKILLKSTEQLKMSYL